MHEQIFTDFGIQPIDHIAMSTPHPRDKRLFIYPAKRQFPGLNLSGESMLQSIRLVGCELQGTRFDSKEIIMLTGRDLLKYFLMVYNASNRMSRSPMNDQLRFQVQLEVRRRIRLCIFVHSDSTRGKAKHTEPTGRLCHLS